MFDTIALWSGYVVLALIAALAVYTIAIIIYVYVVFNFYFLKVTVYHELRYGDDKFSVVSDEYKKKFWWPVQYIFSQLFSLRAFRMSGSKLEMCGCDLIADFTGWWPTYYYSESLQMYLTAKYGVKPR